MTPDNERQQSARERKRALGLVSVTVWLTPEHAEVIKRLARDDLAAVYASLSEGQQPLGADFEAVWDANAEKLYEP